MHFTSFALVWTDEAGRPKTDAAEARAKTGPDVSGVDRRKYMPVGTSLPKRLYIRSHRHTFTDHPSATSHGGDMPCLKNGWKVAEVGGLHFPQSYAGVCRAWCQLCNAHQRAMRLTVSRTANFAGVVYRSALQFLSCLFHKHCFSGGNGKVSPPKNHFIIFA